MRTSFSLRSICCVILGDMPQSERQNDMAGGAMDGRSEVVVRMSAVSQ